MQGGDISDDAPSSIWVVSDLILNEVPVVNIDRPKRGWFGKQSEPEEVSYGVTLDTQMLSLLWKYKQSVGSSIKMEMVYFGDSESGVGDRLLNLLDSDASSPFSNVLVFDGIQSAMAVVPYRPDLIAVVDASTNLLQWGSLGRTVMDLV